MNLREKLNQIKTLEETSMEVSQYVAEYGIITGSVAFGVQTEDSDIDVILPYDPDSEINCNEVVFNHNGIVLDIGDDIFYEDKDIASCYVLDKRSNIYNLLFMTSNEAYEEWKFATNEMLRTINDVTESDFREKIKDRDYRINYFKALKTLHGAR